MRLSSPTLADAFIDGALSQGTDVVDYGMIPTDMLYFAAGALDEPAFAAWIRGHLAPRQNKK